MSDSEAALLVVDDIEDNRFALSRRLARQGYLNVTTAADGRQALELLSSRPFDLVLLDIMMPNVNGYEVLTAMKANERLRHIPVIMISAVDEIDSVVRCIELGAEDYLPKPFDPTLLRARVGACLERKRLHDRVTARTRELTQALEQQTATSEVLRVISSSPSELAPVFHAMLANATRLCEANFGTLNLHDNGSFPVAATHNVPDAYAEYRRRHPLFNVGPSHPLARVAATKQVLQIADMRAEALYLERDPSFIAMGDLAGARTLLIVPMLKENDLLGAITIFRQEVRRFTDKQIELVKNFAAQAVIAIENTRLLNELRESLQQQTASADILRAIASSPAKAERALNVIAKTTARRFEASNVNIRLLDGNILRYVGSTGPTAEHMQAVFPEGPPDANTTSGKAILERRQTYLRGDDVPVSSRAAGIVSSVATPLIREGQAIGVLMVLRSDPRPFIDTDMAQLSNFADQAVIAIENTRLLNELRESLQQQTATADVLKVISRSTFDLKPVFQTLVESAVRLCGADYATITRQKDGVLFFAEAYGYSSEFIEYVRALPVERGRGTATGRALLEC